MKRTSPLRKTALSAATVALFLAAACGTRADEPGLTRSWAIAECGRPLYDEGMDHFPYVKPDAPKGGRVVLTAYGTFDTLNYYIEQGSEWPEGIGLTTDQLMVGSGDELDAYYGLVAESVEYPADKSWIIFNLRPEARYHDGTPITAADFKFAFDTIKQHGRPFLRSFYADIESADVLDDHRIKFTFKTRNNMKPLTVAAGTEPLPQKWWSTRDITKPIMEPPLTSGPYRIKALDPGRSVTYERVKDYWAADLPVNRGRYNFDEIRYDYYRDDAAQFEAFKAGKADFWTETSVQRWMTQYDIPQVRDGRILKRTAPNNEPRGIGGYWINTRRPQFADLRVRRALGYLYDFATLQRTLLFGKFKRIKSYFPNSDYGAKGPPTPEELAVLDPYKDQLPPEVLTQAYEPPRTDGSGRIRENQRKALALFKEAGWVLKAGRLVRADTGEQMRLEILTGYPEWQRLSGQFIDNMRQTGIEASVRLIDSAQWVERGNSFDFDLMTGRLNFFPPPGPELRSYFDSGEADEPGSANLMGIRSPVVDALVEQIIATSDCERKKVITRALDRVLLWNETTIPSYYNDEVWFAHWDKFGWPERSPRYGIGFPDTYWMKPSAATSAESR
ncbi:MAG: ABC transporter substrate-binding protein [Rhodospirillaceae bacterium]|nr:ABC transporter substrate-binding protein [Rhodospirillaceae bacterium]